MNNDELMQRHLDEIRHGGNLMQGRESGYTIIDRCKFCNEHGPKAVAYVCQKCFDKIAAFMKEWMSLFLDKYFIQKPPREDSELRRLLEKELSKMNNVVPMARTIKHLLRNVRFKGKR
jgi:ATP/maltotriose-dependent transcriptional regulator MalT